MRFDLFSADKLVASSVSLPWSDTPVFLSSGWDGAIDKVVLSSPLHAFYVLDDLTFTAVSQVPESATLALMLAGVAVVAGAARRRRRSQKSAYSPATRDTDGDAESAFGASPHSLATAATGQRQQ